MAPKAPRSVVYVVTCGTCGHSWQRKEADDGQMIGCIFCGHVGRLCLGVTPQLPSDWGGTQRVEAWLRDADVQGVGADRPQAT